MGNEKYDHGIRLLTQSISERPVPTPISPFRARAANGS